MGASMDDFLRLIRRCEDLRFSFFKRSRSCTASTGDNATVVVDFPLLARPKTVNLLLLVRSGFSSLPEPESSRLSFEEAEPVDLVFCLVFSFSFEDLCFSFSLDFDFSLLLSLSPLASVTATLRSREEPFLSFSDIAPLYNKSKPDSSPKIQDPRISNARMGLKPNFYARVAGAKQR